MKSGKTLLVVIFVLVAVMTSGCGGCGDSPPAAPSLPMNVTLLEAPLSGLSVPGDVMAFGGTGPLIGAVASIQALMTQTGAPLPPLEPMAVAALRSELALKSEVGLDLTMPIRFAAFSPKAYPTDSVALLIGTKGEAAFIATVPDDRQVNVPGNAYQYARFPGATLPIYVNFIGQTAVITRAADMFLKHRDFLQRLSAAKVNETVEVVFAVRNLTLLYGPEVDTRIDELHKSVAQVLSVLPKAGPSWMVKAAFDSVGGVVKELDEVRFFLRARGDGLNMSLAFQPSVGSGLSKVFSELRGAGDGAFLDVLPADSPFFLWANFSPTRLADSAKRIADVTVGPMVAGDATKKELYSQAMVDAISAMSGEFAVAAHGPLKGEGLSVTTLFGVQDPNKARLAQAALTQIAAEPGAVDYYAKQGLVVAMKDAAYAVEGASVAIVTLKPAADNLMLRSASVALADAFSHHIAVGSKFGVYAMGEDARPRIEAVLGGKLAGGLRAAVGPALALKHAAKNSFFLVYVSPIEIVRRARLAGANAWATLVEPLKNETGLALSAGVDGASLAVVLDMPIEQATKLFQLVEKLKGPR